MTNTSNSAPGDNTAQKNPHQISSQRLCASARANKIFTHLCLCVLAPWREQSQLKKVFKNISSSTRQTPPQKRHKRCKATETPTLQQQPKPDRQLKGRHGKKIQAIIFNLLLLLQATSAKPTYGDETIYTIDIPAQNVAQALTELSEQTDIQVLFPYDIAQSRTGNPVKGNYPIQQALDQLLQNTGLSGGLSNKGVLMISEVKSDENEHKRKETMNSRKNILAAVIGFLVGAGGVNNVSAQGGSEVVPGSKVVLDEVIVTAEKRAESAQSIPIAISAFSGESIEEAGVTGIRDLKQLVPSLQFGQSSVDTFVSIRGIGAELANIGAEAGVTISMDGIPFSSQFMFDSDFFDVERVEVLRGPQGTINGRNATGGAINIYSVRPDEELGGGLKATVGNYSRFSVEGFVTGPIVEESLLGRFAIRTEQADGWLKNTFRDEDKNDADKVQARASFIANLSNDLEAYLVIEGMIDQSSPVAAVDLGRARVDQPGFAESQGVPGFDFDSLRYQADFADTRRIESYKGSLKLTWDLGRSSTITSTTGVLSWEREGKDDFDGTIIAGSHFDRTDVDLSQFSEEITLTADLTKRLDVTLGGLYLKNDAKEVLLLGVPLLDLPEGSLRLGADQDLTSWAIYTQWRYQITDNLRVSIGGRYTNDSKDYAENDSAAGFPFSPIGSPASDTWGAFTPRLAVDYSLTESTTLYVSASRGFKSGGFNTFANSQVDEFDPEFVWNYEAGAKARWLDGRLAAAFAGFYMDYVDIQQTLLRSPAGGGVALPSVANGGNATIKGVELEFDAIVTEQLSIRASGTWLDATYDELHSSDPVFPELGERDLAGNQIVRAPEFQFNLSGEYTLPLMSEWQAVLRADYQWQDKFYFTFYNHELGSQDSYGLLNLSVSVETDDGRWQVTAIARNVLDEKYLTGSFVQNLGAGNQRAGNIGEPRMYGVSIMREF